MYYNVIVYTDGREFKSRGSIVIAVASPAGMQHLVFHYRDVIDISPADLIRVCQTMIKMELF